MPLYGEKTHDTPLGWKEYPRIQGQGASAVPIRAQGVGLIKFHGAKFHGAPSGGQDPKSWGHAHAHRHAPSLEQGQGHRLSRASLLKQSSTWLCLLCWELCLSQIVGPQMVWAAASPHRGAVVSTHFLTWKQATHRHPHSTSSESAALVLLKLICLLALKNTSLGSSRGESRRGGGEQNARQWRQPREENEPLWSPKSSFLQNPRLPVAVPASKPNAPCRSHMPPLTSGFCWGSQRFPLFNAHGKPPGNNCLCRGQS